MNENVPSLEEIAAAWGRKCRDVNCEECKLEDNSSRQLCHARYIHAVLTGEMKLTDSFHKEKPKLPVWCRVGAWVTTSLDGNVARDRLYQISVIEEEENGLSMLHFLGRNREESFTFSAENLKPVHFRAYTFEEARKLLGKVMEYKKNFGIYATIIHEVSNNSGHVRINDWSQGFLLNEYEATIDGEKFGVPEVDEMLLKGGQE